MTIAATFSFVSSLPPSKFVFHPIVVEPNDELWKDERTEVACLSSIGHQDGEDSNMDVLTPYPAYATTSEEIQGWKELERSLGENWSLQLAGELSPCEMSLDGTVESDEVEEEEEVPDSSYVFDDESFSESSDSYFLLEENEETKRNRNLLWKQSLKLSLFT